MKYKVSFKSSRGALIFKQSLSVLQWAFGLSLWRSQHQGPSSKVGLWIPGRLLCTGLIKICLMLSTYGWAAASQAIFGAELWSDLPAYTTENPKLLLVANI